MTTQPTPTGASKNAYETCLTNPFLQKVIHLSTISAKLSTSLTPIFSAEHLLYSFFVCEPDLTAQCLLQEFDITVDKEAYIQFYMTPKAGLRVPTAAPTPEAEFFGIIMRKPIARMFEAIGISPTCATASPKSVITYFCQLLKKELMFEAFVGELQALRKLERQATINDAALNVESFSLDIPRAPSIPYDASADVEAAFKQALAVPEETIFGREQEAALLQMIAGQQFHPNAMLIGNLGTGRRSIIRKFAITANAQVFSFKPSILSEAATKIPKLRQAFSRADETVLLLDCELLYNRLTGAYEVELIQALMLELETQTLPSIFLRITKEEYVQHSGALQKFFSYFTPVCIDQVAVELLPKIISAKKVVLENLHGVVYSTSACEKVVQLSKVSQAPILAAMKILDAVGSSISRDVQSKAAETSEEFIISAETLESEAAKLLKFAFPSS